MRLISAHKISVKFDANTVLSKVDFTIDRAEIVTVVGPNGSGKSSLMRAIIGAVPLSSGTLERTPDLRIGYVPQTLHIDATLPLSVERFLHLPHTHDADVISTALEQVGADKLGQKQMANLSGGQFRRVMLARALLGKPNLLILDEPTTGLDQSGSAGFYRLIEKVRTELNCAVLMVSHELHVVMSASDRVICLNGHVCCHGTPEVVANAPEYRELFGSGSMGALALYKHDHDHTHDHSDAHSHDHGKH